MRIVAPSRHARSLRALAAVVATALAATVLPGTLAPAAADPDGTITLPSQQSSERFERLHVHGSGVDGDLVVSETRHVGDAHLPAEYSWVKPDGTRHPLPADLPLGSGRNYVSGTVLTGQGTVSDTIRRYDLATQAPAPGDGTTPLYTDFSLAGVTDDGWIEFAGSNRLALRRPGRPDLVVAPVEGRESVIMPVARDTDVYWLEPAQYPKRIVRLDGTSDVISTIHEGSWTILRLFVSDTRVTWVDRSDVVSEPYRLCTVARSGGQPACVPIETYNTLDLIGVSDTHAFWGDWDGVTKTYTYLTSTIVAPDEQTLVTWEGAALTSDGYDPWRWGNGLVVLPGNRHSIAAVAPGSTVAKTLATAAPLAAEPIALSMSAGRLAGADDRTSEETGSAVTTLDNRYSGWARTITSRAPLTVSSEEPLSSGVFRTDGGSAITLAGARAAHISGRGAESGPCTVSVTDEGVLDRSVTMARCDAPVMSGPYYAQTVQTSTGVVAQILSVDNRLVESLSCSWPGTYDLFGSRLVSITAEGSVVVRDLSAPVSSSNPRSIGHAGCGDAELHPRVSVWGQHVVVTDEYNATVYDLGTGSVRYGPKMPKAEVGDGSVVWQDVVDWTSVVRAQDLTNPDAAPVTIGRYSTATPTRPMAVDDHLVAWQDASTWAIKVAPLPFGQATPHPPRLLGLIAPITLGAAPSGAVSPWHAEFDVTKPLSSWKLELHNASGTVIKAWSGTAPLGGIRVDWDGKVGSRWAAGGRYTWTLTGSAADGEGTLRNLDGQAATLTGVVTVKDAHVRDLGRDRLADLVAMDSTGVVWRFNGKSTGTFSWRVNIGSGWSTYNAVVSAGDLTGDGRPDLLVRDSAGTLYRYDGTGIGTIKPRVTVSTGWQRFTSIVGVGDLTGDGRRDLVARDGAGVLYRYDGTGTGGFKTGVQIDTGWQAFTAIVGSGDLTGDGQPDVLVRDSTGTLFRYDGTGSGGFAPRVKLGGGWAGFTALVAIGDVTSDGHADLLARDSYGVTYRYPGNGKGSFGTRASLGTGYSAYTRLF